MSDIVDRANEEADYILANQIKHSKRKVSNNTPKGVCLYCDEPVNSHKLFCSTDCSSDHEREEKQKIRSGG